MSNRVNYYRRPGALTWKGLINTSGRALQAAGGSKAVYQAGKQVAELAAKMRKNKQKNKVHKHDKYSKIREGHGDITFSKTKVYYKPKTKTEKRLANIRGQITRRYVSTNEQVGEVGRQSVNSYFYFEVDHLRQMITDSYVSIPSYESGTSGTINQLEPFIGKSNHCMTLTNFKCIYDNDSL